jgi:hypothetical protein
VQATGGTIESQVRALNRSCAERADRQTIIIEEIQKTKAAHHHDAPAVIGEHVFEMPSCRPACVVFLFNCLNFEMA